MEVHRGEEALPEGGEAMRRQKVLQMSALRMFALKGLAELGGSKDIPRVEPFLNHPNPLMQSRARKTLEMLKRKSQDQ